jgi:tyrosine-protein kinase Etk/Wzc
MLGLAGAYSYLRFVAVPKYSITSTILIREEVTAPTLSGLTNTTEEFMKPGQNINDEMQILRSRDLMLRVISELGLYASYYLPGEERKVELYGKVLPISVAPFSNLKATAYGKTISIFLKADSVITVQEGTKKIGDYKLGQQIFRPYGTFVIVPTIFFGTLTNTYPNGIQIVFSDPKEVADSYSQLLTVASVNKDASVLNLALISTLPEKGLDVMNKLLAVYNKEAVEDKNLSSANKISFLDNRLKYLASELSGVERNMEQYKQLHSIADVGVQTSDNVEQAGSYQRKLGDWATQIQVLESIEQYLKKNVSQYRSVPSTLGIQDQTLLELIARFNNLNQKREEMLRTTQQSNPLVLNLNEQIDNMRSSILENLSNIKDGLVITSRNLRMMSGQFQTKLSDAPVVERELQAKGRQQQLKQNIYVYLLQKREEAALALAATASNSRIIDSATISEQPISPNRKMTYLFGLLLGIGVPLSIIYAMNTIYNKIETRQEVEELTNTPILGEIAHNNNKTLVVPQDSRNALAEMFGLVRANLNFAMAGSDNKIVLVTSNVSGEGKTFVSLNLSNSLVSTGKKVVLLELDLRMPSLSKALDLQSTLGITNYLKSDDLTIDDIIQVPARTPNLMVVTAGSIPLNPAELLTSTKLNFLVSQLKELCDIIIIDTPPLGLVADAFIINSLTSSTICVVRYNHTKHDQVKFIETLYESKKFNNLMLVLNDSRTNIASYYGQGGPKDSARNEKQQVEA